MFSHKISCTYNPISVLSLLHTHSYILINRKKLEEIKQNVTNIIFKIVSYGFFQSSYTFQYVFCYWFVCLIKLDIHIHYVFINIFDILFLIRTCTLKSMNG